ncbi:hypothetical protein IGJ83_003224 [Enterococcus pernyi]|uniref:CBM-cenC domain-containing protein n=1 Tax=Candidatus Enterococcus mangumiae TaxID=2230878 RepID=A0ABZ2SVZ8_9ENTE|nr:hypothetical protein [Enterococcus sp. DIV1094]MBO0490044.1 hypothetical protein [Enterococcus sp. DIV1094]
MNTKKMITLACSTLMLGGLGLGIATTSLADTMPVSETQSQVKGWESALVDPTFNDLSNWNGAQALGQKIEKQENAIRVTAINNQISLGQKGSMIANHDYKYSVIYQLNPSNEPVAIHLGQYMLAGDIYGLDGIPGANVELIADGNWHELSGEFNFDEPDELGIYKNKGIVVRGTNEIKLAQVSMSVKLP